MLTVFFIIYVASVFLASAIFGVWVVLKRVQEDSDIILAHIIVIMWPLLLPVVVISAISARLTRAMLRRTTHAG